MISSRRMDRSRAVAMSALRALPRLTAPALIVIAVGLATWKLTLGDRAIARGDLLLYFYPLRDYASAAIREGRLPLWNPHTFMGAPFLANSQAGFFYPLNVLTAWMPVEQAVSWNIALHLALAGLGLYALARRGMGLRQPAALASGLAFGLGGYLGAQVEHLNQLQALAWLPWQMLCLFALRRGNVLRTTLALAALIALQFLAGHTQSLYICLVALGLTAGALAIAPVDARRAGDSSRIITAITPFVTLGAAGILALALAGAQLMPTLELAAQSARSGGLPYNEVGSFSWRPWVAARALMPTYGDPLFPEYVVYFGAAGLALALLGALASFRVGVAPTQWRRNAAPALTLTVAGFVLALGIATPVFGILYQFAPGFNLFRAPARWLALLAVGVSLLVGLGAQALWEGLSRRLVVGWLLSWCALAVMGALGVWLGARFSPETEYQTLPAPGVLTGWLVAVFGVTAWIAGALVTPVRHRAGPMWRVGWLAAVSVELLVASQFQPYARASDRAAITSLRPATAHLLAGQALSSEQSGEGGRILALSGLFFDPGDLPEQRLIYQSQLSEDELYDRVIASKHKEILSPNLALYYRLQGVDGYDGGLLPLKRYAEFVSQFAPREDAHTVDGRLREFLRDVPDSQWLSRMAVQHIVVDKTLNVPIDNVFYDFQFSHALTQPATFALDPFESTALGVVLSAPNSRPGALLAWARIDVPGQPAHWIDLIATEAVTRPFFALRLSLGTRASPAAITITPTTPSLTVRGLASIDEDAGAFLTQLARPQRDLRLVYSGDVKIYERTEPSSRAFVRDHSGAIAGSARILSDLPERVAIEVQAARDGELVLRDACYPGWTAEVNGQPASVECTDILFRAVAVPAGESRVVMAYQPASVSQGLVLSAAGIVVWAGLGVLAWRRRAQPAR